jgi:hypothetical protein
VFAGIPSVGSSVLSLLRQADGQSMAAASSIASGNLDNLVDASMALSMAKVSVGVAADLSRTQDEMFQSTLDILV